MSQMLACCRRFSHLLVILLVGLFMVSSAVAAPTLKAGAGVRVDYQINSTNNDTLLDNGKTVKTNKELETKKFDAQYAKFWTTGQLDDGLTIDMVLDLTSATFGLGDGAAVEQVYGNYKFHDNFNFSFGKLFLKAGGVENSLADYDVYLPSLSWKGFDRENEVQSAPTHGTLLYKKGISFSANVLEQQFSLFVFNGNDTIKNEKTPGFGLVWQGSFLNKMIRPIASWHTYKDPEQVAGGPTGTLAANEKKYNFFAIGSEFELLNKALYLNFDFLKNTYESYTTKDKKDSTQTLQFGAQYNHNGNCVVRPLAKFETSKLKIAEDEYLKRNAYVIGLEFFPRVLADKGENKDMPRFHLVYTSAQDEYKKAVTAGTKLGGKAVGKKVRNNQVLLGATLAF